MFRAKQGKHGDGGLLTGLTWDQLVDKWKQFSGVARLTDVETYVSGGKRRFVGVWRAGPGNGALYLTGDWTKFSDLKKSLNASQDLLDFERYLTGDGKWRYLGVWRNGAPSGRMHRTQSWATLADRWKDYKPSYTLIDVEPYLALPARIQ